jgi:DNA polymerase-3 subunit epsilon
VLAATHARARLVLAEHPQGGRFDAFWLVGGRVVDWGPLGGVDDVLARTRHALRGGDGTGATACLAPGEVEEAKIVATWLDAHEARTLALGPGVGRGELEVFLSAAGTAAR